MARGARRSRGDVLWFVPGRKTPIAASTAAESLTLGLLAEQGHTFASARDALTYGSPEEHAILAAYIERGYADTKMQDLGVQADAEPTWGEMLNTNGN